MTFRIILCSSIFLLLAQRITSKPTGVLTHTVIQSPTSHSSQFLLISPQTKHAYKILPHYIQPLSNLHLPQEELVFYYPNTYLSDDGELLPLVHLRQEDIPWWQALWNFISGGQSSGEETTEIPSEGSSEGEGTSEGAPETEVTPEELPETGETTAENPDSATEKKSSSGSSAKSDKPQLIKHNNQYYIINGLPQFYGNFDASNNPISPFISVQTLQPANKVTNEEFVRFIH